MPKQSSKKTDIQMVVERVDNQLAKIVESVKILHETSMEQVQYMKMSPIYAHELNA